MSFFKVEYQFDTAAKTENLIAPSKEALLLEVIRGWNRIISLDTSRVTVRVMYSENNSIFNLPLNDFLSPSAEFDALPKEFTTFLLFTIGLYPFGEGISNHTGKQMKESFDIYSNEGFEYINQKIRRAIQVPEFDLYRND
jgi:hypothetical protein